LIIVKTWPINYSNQNFMANAKKEPGAAKATPKKKSAPKKASKSKAIKLGGVPTKGM
jgi:hypothetical protein